MTHIFLVDDAFGGWVMVKTQANTPEQLVQALKDGPLPLDPGTRPSTTSASRAGVVVDRRRAFGIYLLGKGSRSVQAEQRGQTTARLDAGRMGKGGFMRVVVVDERGRSAWSNPMRRGVDRAARGGQVSRAAGLSWADWTQDGASNVNCPARQ
jgi:hypothetical protein